MNHAPAQSPLQKGIPLVIALFLSFCCMGSDTSYWYEFRPQNTTVPGEIGMQAWLPTPAGQHGRITSKQDALYYNLHSDYRVGI